MAGSEVEGAGGACANMASRRGHLHATIANPHPRTQALRAHPYARDGLMRLRRHLVQPQHDVHRQGFGRAALLVLLPVAGKAGLWKARGQGTSMVLRVQEEGKRVENAGAGGGEAGGLVAGPGPPKNRGPCPCARGPAALRACFGTGTNTKFFSAISSGGLGTCGPGTWTGATSPRLVWAAQSMTSTWGGGAVGLHAFMYV